jgi:hypothetical protein
MLSRIHSTNFSQSFQRRRSLLVLRDQIFAVPAPLNKALSFFNKVETYHGA